MVAMHVSEDGQLKLHEHASYQGRKLASDLRPGRQYLLVGQRGGRQRGRYVRDAREPETADPPRPGDDHLRHGRHPDGVGAEALQHADFRRGFVRRAEQRGVHPLLEGDLLLERHLPGEGAEIAVIGITHVGEALLSLFDRALQRVPKHQVDVIRDEHQGRRAEHETDPAGGVGDDEGADAQTGEHPYRQRRHLGRVALIEMKAAAQDEYGHTLEGAGDELALVARRGGLGKARNGGLRNADGGLNRIGHRSQTRSEDDCDARLERADPARDDVGSRADGTAPRSLLPVGHSRIPANVADRKFASVPAIIARKPSRARSCLRSGASAPMPPIWMPTELTLANPHKAKVAIVNESGSSCPRSGPRSLYAMNSFSTMRSPSRLPMVPLSCQGTPMAQAIGRKIQPSTV